MMSGSLLFTKAEFEQQYGGVTEWERAAPRAASSARGRGGSVADLSSILRQHAAAGRGGAAAAGKRGQPR